MLKSFSIAVAAAVVALLAAAAFKPDTLRLSHSADIVAPPQKACALNDALRRFNEWNPFAMLGPHNAITYDTVTALVGGACIWAGQKSAAGRKRDVASVPPQRVKATPDFDKPVEVHNTVDCTVPARGDKSSTVSWSMHGPMPYVNRLLTIFFAMDKIFGKAFAAGLAHLKTLAERP